MNFLALATVCFFGFGDCSSITVAPTGERELRPPTSGIRLGSLYYVREKPTENISKPANLIKLCTTRLDRHGIVPEVQRVADIDLLEKLEGSAALDGVKSQFVQLGLNGSLTNYFTYKLTNVTRSDISRVEADRILNVRGEENDCADWRDSMRGQNWGVYQIAAISVGDIQFARNTDIGGGGDVKINLVKLEPSLKASLKKVTGLAFSGKGLVISFQPILRN
ncbi:MAG: hypothetical protein WAM62_05445 [Pseudolabrys sp.]